MAEKDGPIGKARALRREQTPAEKALWEQLANRRLARAKFRRQQPIGPYIVDFVSFADRLVIELDGGHHDTSAARESDIRRTAWLEGEGFAVLRFWNGDVLGNLEGVVHMISAALEPQRKTPST